MASACTIDKDYVIDDLSKIDTAITLFGDGISVPIGSSEKLTFSKLLNSAGEDINSFVKTGANGNLSLVHNGKISLNDKLEEMDFAEMSKINGISFSKEFKATKTSVDNKPAYQFNQVFNLTIKNLPEELTKLDEVILDNVFLTIDATIDGVPETTTPFPIEMTMKLPDFIYPSSVPVYGNIVNGKFQPDPIKIEKLYGLNVAETDSVEGEITVSGTVYTNSVVIDLNQLKPVITVDFNAKIQDKDGKIAISKAKGYFTYEFEQTAKIELDAVPAMFKKDQINLDLDNAKLDFEIVTNLGVPLLASIEMVPYLNGIELKDNIITIDNLTLPYSETAEKKSTKTYSICRSSAYATVGKEYIQADISKILRKIPDYLKLNIKAHVDPNVIAVLEPNAVYSMFMDYGLDVVLSFGKDFKFGVVTNIDLSNASNLLTHGKIGIKGKVVNDSPLKLKAVMDLLDEDLIVIPQTEECSLFIDGSSSNDVEFYLSPVDKTVKPKKIRVDITVTAIPDVTVKASDFVQFLDLIAVIPKGITL